MKLILYVVRKSYADVDSQIAAYKNRLDNAIKDCPPGYNVYNALNGKICYSNPIKNISNIDYEKLWCQLRLEVYKAYESTNNKQDVANAYKTIHDYMCDMETNEVRNE